MSLLIVPALILVLVATSFAAEVKLTFWGMSSSSEEQELAVVNEFNRRHAGSIKVEAVSGISGTDLREKLSVAIAANAAPDVVRFDRFALAEWADKGLFHPLDALINLDNFTNEDFYPAAWNETIYQGKTYGIPWNMDSRAYLYNKAAFSESGLDPATSPRTWDEVIEFARKLDRRTSEGFTRIGFLAHDGNWYFLGWLLAAGGNITDSSGRNVTWNSDAGRRAAHFMVDIAAYYGGYRGARDVTGGGTSSSIPSGRLASVVDFSGMVGSSLRKNPSLELGVGPAPRPAELAHEKITWSGGFAMSIPITVPENKMNPIWEFIKFFTSKDGMVIAFQQDVAGISGQLPTRRSVILDSTYAMKQPAALSGFVELLPYARFRPVIPDGESLYELYRRRLADMIMKENVVPDQAVAETARLGQLVLDQRWAGR